MFGCHYYYKVSLKCSNFLSVLSFNPFVSTPSLRASGHAFFCCPTSLVLFRNTSFEKPISFSPGFSHLREQLGLSGLWNNTTIIIFKHSAPTASMTFSNCFFIWSDDLLWSWLHVCFFKLGAMLSFTDKQNTTVGSTFLSESTRLGTFEMDSSLRTWSAPWKCALCISTAVGTVRHGHLDVHLCGLDSICKIKLAYICDREKGSEFWGCVIMCESDSACVSAVSHNLEIFTTHHHHWRSVHTALANGLRQQSICL